MRTIDIKLKEEDATALADLVERLLDFHIDHGSRFLPRVELALTKCVDSGFMEFKEAFRLFGIISQVTNQISMRSESIGRIMGATDEALEQAYEDMPISE